MHDTIDDRGGHVSVAEHLAPPSELQVRGEHHAPLLVGIRDDLEQESGPVDVDGQIAQLVDDQQPGAPIVGSSASSRFSSLARRRRITSDDAVKNLTGMPLSHASMPVAIAMCVLPHPTSP